MNSNTFSAHMIRGIRSLVLCMPAICIVACDGAGSLAPPTGTFEAQGIWPNSVDAALFPMGAQAQGTTILRDMHPVYEFEFVGDETLIYRIDTSHPEVASGLIRVEEVTFGVTPMAKAGFLHRGKGESVLEAQDWALMANAQLSSQVNGDVLTLSYIEGPDGVLAKEYRFELVGKALRMQVRDTNSSLSGMDHYAGFDFGRVEGVQPLHALEIPYMISTPVTRFTGTSGDKGFCSVQVDWSRSNSSAPVSDNYETIDSGSGYIDRGDILEYALNSEGAINAPLAETLWIQVSREIEELFPSTEAGPSPYRQTLVGRTVGLFSRRNSWETQIELFELMDEWGMDNMSIYDFYWWSAILRPFTTQQQTHLWTPAYDEAEFIPYANRAGELGYQYGCYTLYGINATQPMHDVTDAVLNYKGTRISRMSPNRALIHSQREDTALRELYGTSLAFTDVIGLTHPGRMVDHEADQLDKAKTVGQALAAKRSLFAQMQAIHEGPCLSEGSGALLEHSHQFEYLNAGFVDSTQSAVNTGAHSDLTLLDVSDPRTPRNWWVMPDYAQTVIRPRQVNHGNGFYDRFFAVGQTPFPDHLLDAYRLTTITYGHCSFFQTTGPINGTTPGQPNNRIYHADHVKEYYMLQALQREYLSSELDDIQYWRNGGYRTASQVLRLSNHPDGPMEELRDPQIRMRYANGLSLYLNHSSDAWPVVLGDLEFVIPENGWVAHNPQTGLLAFFAIPVFPAADAPGQAIDYCHAPGWYEFMDGRGEVAAYGNLVNDREQKRVYLKNHIRAITLVEIDQGNLITTTGVEPQLLKIELSGPTQLLAGQQGTLLPQGIYSNDLRADYSYLLGEWSSSTPQIVSVNRAGVVTALMAGTARVRFASRAGVVAEVELEVR